MLGLFQDTTQRKQAEEALRQSEERHRAITETAQDAIITADSDGRIRLWNPAAERIFGYSAAEILGRNMLECIVPPQYREAKRKGFAEFVRTGQGPVIGKTLELTALRKDGTEFPIEISVSGYREQEGWVAVALVRDITSRRQAQEALRKSEMLNRTLVEHLPQRVFIKDRNSVYMCCNRNYAHDLGIEPEQIVGKDDFAFYPRELAEAHRADDQAVMSAGTPSDIEEPYLVGGKQRWIRTVKVPYRDEEGRVVGVLGVFEDITERRRTEQELLQLRRATDDATDAVLTVGPDGEVTYVNLAFQDLFRCTLDDARERGWNGFCADPNTAHEILQTTMGLDKWSGEAELVRKDGQTFIAEVRAAPILDDVMLPTGMFVFVHDITARKRAEDEIRRAHAEAEQLLASISAILIGADAENRIRRWNSAAEATFGLAVGQVAGRKLAECGVEWEWPRVAEAIARCQAEQRPVRVDDVHFQRSDGTPGFLGLTISPVKERAAASSGILIIGSDITQRKLLQAQLSQAQRLESIGQLAAGIAHEINTPTQFVGDNTRFLQQAFGELQTLLAKYAELLEASRSAKASPGLVAEVEAEIRKVELDYLAEEIPKAIEQSLDGVERVARIVRAMKDFSHPGGEEHQAVDINRAIESTATVARNEWKYVAELTLDLDPELPPVPCMPGDLNQAILNLLVNAAHAIADVVGDGSKGKGRITIRTRRDGRWAEIRISDTGTGIPEEVRARVFEPFFTTKDVGRGTGQGLTITHNVVVQKHRGTIAFETEVGKGTTFIIRLPLEPETTVPAEGREEPGRAARHAR